MVQFIPSRRVTGASLTLEASFSTSEGVTRKRSSCRAIAWGVMRNSVERMLEVAWHWTHLRPSSGCGVKRLLRHRSRDGAVTGTWIMGGASALEVADLAPRSRQEMTSAASPRSWSEWVALFWLTASMASSASAASCCWPEARDGFCREMALISSVGRTILPWWWVWSLSSAIASPILEGANEMSLEFARRHWANKLMKQVLPRLVKPRGGDGSTVAFNSRPILPAVLETARARETHKTHMAPWPLHVPLGDLLRGHWHQMTQSKPGLLLRTTQKTDFHQPHLDISTQFGDINRKRSQCHLYFLNKFSPNLLNGRIDEPAVSRACSAGPGPYLPIGIFLVIGRI